MSAWEQDRYGGGSGCTLGGFFRLHISWSTDRARPGYVAQCDGRDVKVKDERVMYKDAADAKAAAERVARKMLTRALADLDAQTKEVT